MDDAIEFSAAYRRYTPELSASLMRISTALGTIRGARVLPAVADQLRASARAGTVHYSNLIEGNQLPVIEAERAARGELATDSRAKIELVNYVKALDLIDHRLEGGAPELTPGFLLTLHGTATRGLGRDDDPHFKPHHEGAWRDGHAVVFDRLTGKVMYEGPPPDEVEPRMVGMFVGWIASWRRAARRSCWLASCTTPSPTCTRSPMAADGSRACSRRRCSCMPACSLVRGLAEEYERVAATVADLSALMPGGSGAPLRLNTGQERALAALRLQGRSRRQGCPLLRGRQSRRRPALAADVRPVAPDLPARARSPARQAIQFVSPVRSGTLVG
ncbi:MAG: hypothetical protein MSC31_03280 [Solirubrobacteraceae bacterium MAG38_C4-C5]|nr:hypothetical protein [Candidatus Siliceabacter maunaloa]